MTADKQCELRGMFHASNSAATGDILIDALEVAACKASLTIKMEKRLLFWKRTRRQSYRSCLKKRKGLGWIMAFFFFFFFSEYSWSSTKLFFYDWVSWLSDEEMFLLFFFFLKTKSQKYRVQFVINIISAHFWYSFHSQKFNYPLKDLPYFHFSPNISIEKKEDSQNFFDF